MDAGPRKWVAARCDPPQYLFIYGTLVESKNQCINVVTFMSTYGHLTSEIYTKSMVLQLQNDQRSK